MSVIRQTQIAEHQTERVTGGMRVITTDHGSIHGGEGFSAYMTKDALADTASHDIAFTVPAVAAGYVHLKFYDVWISNAAGLLQIYENPDSVAGGDAITPVNRRRLNTPPVSGVTVANGATVDLTGAVLLETLRFGGGGTNPQGRSGGDRSMDIEWVLKPETDYVFRITNQSGVAADVGAWLFWYEEEDA